MTELIKTPWRWMAAFVIVAFAVTVATASLMLFRHLQLADQYPYFPTVLVWQTLIYAFWIPIAVIVWRTFDRLRLSPPAIRRFLFMGGVVIPLHAVGGTFIDIGFSEPGAADLVAMAVQRAQLDILIYLSFGILAIAADFHRKGGEEAAATAAIKLALERSLADDRKAAASGAAEARRLMVSAGSKQIIVQLNEVEWFGSAGNYVVVNWEGREGLIRRTIRSVEDEVDSLTFARIHRGTVANLSKVESAQSLSDGSWRLQMKSGAELIASRSYKSEILARLNTA